MADTAEPAPHVHVIGAGLAGLSAALDLAAHPGLRVTLHEATPHAGGLCRSYHDARLDRVIDTGNHLVLSANRAVLAHAARVGASDRLQMLEPVFPFLDLASGARWRLRVPRTPLGALSADSRPPGTRIADFADVARLLAAGPDHTVAQVVRGRGAFWRSFWDPLTVGVLNTPPQQASARLMRTMLLKTFLRGAHACRPVIAPQGLGPALIDPAVARLQDLGAELRFRHPLAALERDADRVTALRFADGQVCALGPRDRVVLALPPRAKASILPDQPVPPPGLSILNAHFRVAPALAQAMQPMLGCLGSDAPWIFRRGDVLSVTVSAEEATPLAGRAHEEALARLWRDVATATGTTAASPRASRLIRMRQATFDQSPPALRRRPPARTPLANLFLAGAQQANGLPCTLESAVLSGTAAARAALSALPG